jgi:glycosyltransferase involved in cell wall biosynthesis
MMAFQEPGHGQNRSEKRIRILVVCTWPLGGIRTWLKYHYRHFPKNRFDITVLAIPTIEKEPFEQDLKAENIPVVWSPPFCGRNILFARVASLMGMQSFDCIHSQGFTAAAHASLGNLFRRLPHVLTMHGILEPKYFRGWAGALKRLLFKRLLRNVTVFHAVGQDMLDHLKKELPTATSGRARFALISSGIDVARFSSLDPNARANLNRIMGCFDDTFVYGYFGRFMPEKGFDCLIRASEILRSQNSSLPDFKILAMGSGDYEHWLKRQVAQAGLEPIVRFHPFRADAHNFIAACDAIVMPSRHEAWGLLACEALVAGVPLIASNAVGLREAVRGSPALTFPVDDSEALASAMRSLLMDRSIRARFTEYRPVAADRYDVRRSAEQLMTLFAELVGNR